MDKETKEKIISEITKIANLHKDDFRKFLFNNFSLIDVNERVISKSIGTYRTEELKPLTFGLGANLAYYNRDFRAELHDFFIQASRLYCSMLSQFKGQYLLLRSIEHEYEIDNSNFDIGPTIKIVFYIRLCVDNPTFEKKIKEFNKGILIKREAEAVTYINIDPIAHKD